VHGFGLFLKVLLVNCVSGSIIWKLVKVL